jgi:plasmid stabilization system protein ParE
MRRVIVSPRAYDDLSRLEDWLHARNVQAAARLGPLLDDAIVSLQEFAERGRAAPRHRFREIVVPFGSAAYVIQYRIEPDRVIVARIRHSRERR